MDKDKERETERSQTAINLGIRRKELEFQLSLIPKLALTVISKHTEKIKLSLASLLCSQLQCTLIKRDIWCHVL